MKHNRWAPLVSAAVFSACYLASIFGVMDLPEGVDSDAAVLASVTDGGGIIVGAYLIAVAGLAMLVFLTQLRGVIGAVETVHNVVSGRLVLVLGSVYVVMLFTSAAVLSAIPFGIAVGELPEDLDPGLVRVLTNLGFVLLLVFGLIAAMGVLLAVSLLAWRGGVLPRWLALTGFVFALLLLLGPFYMPQLLVPLWTLLVGAVIASRQVPASGRR